MKTRRRTSNLHSSPEGSFGRAMEESTMKVHGYYEDSFGNSVRLEGDSVQEIAEQLDEDDDVVIEVRDEPGFTRGWVRGRNDWRAQ